MKEKAQRKKKVTSPAAGPVDTLKEPKVLDAESAVFKESAVLRLPTLSAHEKDNAIYTFNFHVESVGSNVRDITYTIALNPDLKNSDEVPINHHIANLKELKASARTSGKQSAKHTPLTGNAASYVFEGDTSTFEQTDGNWFIRGTIKFVRTKLGQINGNANNFFLDVKYGQTNVPSSQHVLGIHSLEQHSASAVL